MRATQPDPFQAFADWTAPGRQLTGRVTKVVPIGAFAQVADGVEALVRVQDLPRMQGEADRVVQIGGELTVVVSEVDRERRKLRPR